MVVPLPAKRLVSFVLDVGKKEILFPVLCFLAAASGSAPFLVSQCLFPPEAPEQAHRSLFSSTVASESHRIIKVENNFSPSVEGFFFFFSFESFCFVFS